MSKNLICKRCGEPRDIGRRICKKCRAKEVRERYRKVGRHNFGKGLCILCKTEITLWRRNQIFCEKCSTKTTSSKGNVKNTYERSHIKKYSFMHRRVAEETIGRKLHRNECCHHLDEDPNNNSPDNLIVMDRSSHSKLHYYLRRCFAGLSDIERNKWESLRIPFTDFWIKDNNCKVMILNEINGHVAKQVNATDLKSVES